MCAISMRLVWLLCLACVARSASGERVLSLADAPCGEAAAASRRFHQRIVGGAVVNVTEFPYVVSLKRNGQHFCGGTLISSTFVLTAAHCVFGEAVDALQVSAGDQNSDVVDVGEQTVAVAEAIVHPAYKIPANDIALVRLATPVAWSEFAKPMCLPASSAAGRSSVSGRAYLAGWGYNREKRDGGEPTKDLHMAKIPIMDNEQCEAWLKSQNKIVKISSEQLCAGREEGKVDGCQADSGGGLVELDGESKSLVLIGVMSRGFGCAREKMPGIYTRVEKYIDWIKENVQKPSFRSIEVRETPEPVEEERISLHPRWKLASK